MAIYQSIHTGLEIDEGITQVGVLTPIVTGNTEQINNINQALVTLDDTVTGNTEQISLRLKLDQTTPQTLTSSPKINDLVAGQMCYVDANKQLKPIDVFWDNVNKRIGTTLNPSGKLDIRGVSTSQPSATLTAGDLVVNTENGVVYIGRLSNAGGDNTRFIFRDRLGNVKSRWENAGNGCISFGNFNINYGITIAGGALEGGATQLGRLVVESNNALFPSALFLTGNVGIKTTAPKSALQVAGGIQCGDDTAAASADKKGTTRYREWEADGKGYSAEERCMKTGINQYTWVAIVTNSWTL